MHSKVAIWAIFLIVVSFFVTSGYAETNNDHTLSPYFYLESDDPSIDTFPLKNTAVTVNVNGVIADVMVTQQYTNNGSRPINARYIFPASTRAAVHGMKMKIGEQVIQAKIKERETAQKEFNDAKKNGKSASLLKQQRPNVFSMNVANIMPQDTIDIELHYTELLVPTENTYQFVYPTVVGPRYSSQSEAASPETDQWIKNPYLKTDTPPQSEFSIAVNMSTGLSLQEVVCTSHEIETEWQDQSVANIRLSDADPFGGNRDFILNYRLAGNKIQSGLLLYEGEEENFFLLMAQPPARVKQADIPNREYIFVVDISGSMHGFPLNTAKKLLTNLIGNLRETDKFNVILFAGGSKLLSPSSIPAIQSNIDHAVQTIDQEGGGGGTELLSALQKSFALPRDEANSRTVLIVTDGYIGAEKEVFQLIRNNLSRTNVFSFGIGSSVNRYLMEGMAKAGQGEPFIVTKPQEAAMMGEKFRTYVQSPVLTDISVQYEGFQAYDIEPGVITDLFAERPLVVFGKYHGRPEGRIALNGISGSGKFNQIIDVSETKPLDVNQALPYLWARTRITELSDANFEKNEKENRAEITSLGLTYNLLTSYTSFIAVREDVRNTSGQAQDVKQPLPLPQHVSHLAVDGSMSKVPEPELIILLSFVLLILLLPSCRRKIIKF